MKHFTHFKSSILRGLLSLFFLTAMVSSAWGEVTPLNLPKTWNTSDGKSAYTEALGCTLSGLGSDYSSAPKLKFDSQGDYMIIQVADAPAKISFNIKGNSTSGTYSFKVQESADGETYTDALNITSVSSSSQKKETNLKVSTRFIKLIYTTKDTGNMGVGGIAITKAVITKTLQSITVSGTPNKTTYEAGESFDPAGLIVTGTYNTGDETITEGIQWTFDPEALSEGSTTCGVIASVGQIKSDVFTVTGLTVTAPTTKYSVNLNTSSHATLSADLTSAAEGATITLSYSNVADHYHFVSWSVINGETPVTVTDNKFTMPAANVTVSATFTEDPKHNVIFYTNGEASAPTSVYEGDAVEFPADPFARLGFEFMGWYSSEYNDAESAPKYITDATMNNQDVSYYAVFALASQGELTTYKLENSVISKLYVGGNVPGNTVTYAERSIGDWTGNFNINKASNTEFIGIGLTTQTDPSKSNYNSHLITPSFDGSITSIRFVGYDASKAARQIYLCSNNCEGNATEEAAIYGQGEVPAAEAAHPFDILIEVKNSPTQMYIYAGTGAIIITGITLTYVTKSYSNYCTTIQTEGEIALAAQSGSDYYATFSSSRAVEFEDATIYTVKVADGNLALTEVENKQIPANTGVLVKTSGTTASYSYIASATALENNLLKPASEEMKGDYKFYKLAYGDWTNKTGLGFYWGYEGGIAFTCKAGTAYLAVPTSAGASEIRGFSFDDLENGNETAIPEIDPTGEVPLIIYTMTGIRIPKVVEDGLYIVNGKTKWMIAE